MSYQPSQRCNTECDRNACPDDNHDKKNQADKLEHAGAQIVGIVATPIKVPKRIEREQAHRSDFLSLARHRHD